MLNDFWGIPLTVLFSVTGLYSLFRWTRAVSTARAGRSDSTIERVVDLNHVVMSVAMVVMIWRPAGSLGTVVQVVVFVAFGVLCLVRLVSPEGALSRVGAGAHLVMNAAMVWMLAAMPLLMDGMVGGAGAGHQHHGGAAAAADMSSVTMATPGWAQAVSLAAVALMVAVSVWWLVRAARTERHRLHLCCHAAMGLGMGLMIAVM